MKKLVLISLFLLSFLAYADKNKADDMVWVSIGADALNGVNKMFSSNAIVDSVIENVALIQVAEKDLAHLSHMMHEDHHRCGGYIRHDDKDEALMSVEKLETSGIEKQIFLADYSIDQEEVVQKVIADVQESKIRQTISKLSSFHNRYYDSQTGVDSQMWLLDHWKSIAASRNDVSVKLFKHSQWKQPSVIATIEGTELKDEIVVIGGHGDSIAGYFSRHTARAPGADDNASGVATFTEVLRLLVDHGVRPKRTIKFMSYAAEEVGLRGSKEIATQYKREGKMVVGVMQLDMTNYKGSADFDIVMMNDYTNAAQNTFIGNLIDHYLHIPWGYSKCGYACSDHASWTAQGFPASIPFESTMQDINKKIHTANDTLSRSNGTADHAAKFAKMAAAFAIELAN